VAVLKLDKKGMTLIESLFAFLIYVHVIVLLISLFSQSLKAEQRIEVYMNNILSEEVNLSKSNTIEKIKEEVLP